jgi:maltose O-acetyltransferase
MAGDHLLVLLGLLGSSAMDAPEWLQHVRAGEPFRMIDMEFIGAVSAARAKLKVYPDAVEASFEAMQIALAGILGKCGSEVVVLPPFAVDVGFNIEIGDRTFINSNSTLLDTYPIRIGRDVMIGPNCGLYPVGHPLKSTDRITRDEHGNRTGQWTTGAPIFIEDDVWLGGNVLVMPGVTIGARSMIGAGSVVTRSIPPDVFAAGNPCRVVRSI